MKLFDSHCHLDDRSYQKDFASVLDRTRTAGVEKIMVVGTTDKSSHEVVSIAEAHENLYASIGIHELDAHLRRGIRPVVVQESLSPAIEQKPLLLGGVFPYHS